MERKGNASDQKQKQMLKIVRRKIGSQHFPGMNAASVFYRYDDLAVQHPSIGSVLNFFLRLDVPVGLPIFVQVLFGCEQVKVLIAGLPYFLPQRFSFRGVHALISFLHPSLIVHRRPVAVSEMSYYL